MKTRSKKWWALTEKQRRHDRSVGRTGYFRNAPRYYRYTYCVKPWKAKCKAAMTRAIVTGDYENMVFPPFRKDAAWNYW
jgi:hypothetical protein